MYGKTLPSLLEKASGVSAKTWKKGGPQSPAVAQRARIDTIAQHLQRLQTVGGYTYDESVAIHRKIDWNDNGLWLTLVRWGLLPDDPHRCPQTEDMARRLDELATQLDDRKLANDVAGCRRVLIESGELEIAAEWLRDVEEIDVNALLHANSESWDSLNPLLYTTLGVAVLRLLACWDVEFFSRYLTDVSDRRGLIPRPLFELVLPTINPRSKMNSDGSYPARGLFLLPIRRALEFSHCLATHHRTRRWPEKHEITRSKVAAAGGAILQGENLSEQPLAKIHSGSRGLTSAEFADVWQSMCGDKSHDKTPLPPWPVYVAAQIWAALFVQTNHDKNTAKAVAIFILDKRSYGYWWEYYLGEFKRQGTFFGNIPWPDYSTNA